MTIFKQIRINLVRVEDNVDDLTRLLKLLSLLGGESRSLVDDHPSELDELLLSLYQEQTQERLESLRTIVTRLKDLLALLDD